MPADIDDSVLIPAVILAGFVLLWPGASINVWAYGVPRRGAERWRSCVQ